MNVREEIEGQAGTSQHPCRPNWTDDGYPSCGWERCPSYDGKRCEHTGSRPPYTCVPVVLILSKWAGAA